MHRELTKVVARAVVRCHQLQVDLYTKMRRGDGFDEGDVLEALEAISQDLVTLQAFLADLPPPAE